MKTANLIGRRSFNDDVDVITQVNSAIELIAHGHEFYVVRDVFRQKGTWYVCVHGITGAKVGNRHSTAAKAKAEAEALLTAAAADRLQSLIDRAGEYSRTLRRV